MLLSKNIRNECHKRINVIRRKGRKKQISYAIVGSLWFWIWDFCCKTVSQATVWPWVHVNLAVVVYFSIRHDDTFLGWLWRLKRYLLYVNMITCYGSIRMISQGPRKVERKMKAISMNAEHKPQGVCWRVRAELGYGREWGEGGPQPGFPAALCHTLALWPWLF